MQNILLKLKELNFLKDNLLFNQSTITNRTTEQNNFLEELYMKYEYLKEYKLSYLINILKKYNPEDCKCIVDGCNHSKIYLNTQKRLRHSCKEHQNHPFVKEYSKRIRKQKTEETNIEKYGVKNVSQSENIKNKKKETLHQNFGELGYKNPEIANKRIITWIKKYGYTNPQKSEDVRNKARENSIRKHGYSHFMKNPELKEKFFNDQLAKKGYIFPRQKNRKNFENLNKEFIEKNFINLNGNIEIDKMASYFGFIDNTEPYRYLKKFNISYKHLKGRSRAEEEIIDFLKEIKPGIKIITNSRNIIKPLELDIYLPEYNLAIEYNGLFWHSFGKNNVCENQSDYLFQRNRHKEKTELCEAKGINLFHIFENEWKDPKINNIIKSMLKNRLKLNTNKIFARKCTIYKIDSKRCNDFLRENHIQGSSNATYKYGLFYNSTLVSVMTFTKSRFDKKIEFELVRFCNLANYNIIGAAGKLLKNFEREFNYPSIISYGNRTFSSTINNIYLMLGFKHTKNNKPNLKFISKNCLEIIPREKLMKHKIKNNPEFNYSEELSVNDNIINNGYRILHGPGTSVYVKNYLVNVR